MVSTLSILTAGLAACASLIQAAPTARDAPLCPPEHMGIMQPANGATITQTRDGNLDGTTVEVVYCSGAYYKTSSLDASALFSFPDTLNVGSILAKNIKPDNKDASAGFYSYRFNVTFIPNSGSYFTGLHTLSIYETTTGEYSNDIR